MGAIREAPPPNASVTALETCEIAPRSDTVFAIRASEAVGPCSAEVLPDLATCVDCLRELFDPSDRRRLYPFINCTHCGPRYSIIEGIPYDRARTSMRHFPMCLACRTEYENPADRRFHAEPNACPACGPRLALWNEAGDVLCREHDALVAAAAAIREGRIVAVKGVGGFHLIVDARDKESVQRLRARKRRDEKPFAVMFPTLEQVAASCRISSVEETLLTGPARPIVLLRRTGGPVVNAVAPRNPWLGALLPYAPLHHLLMRELGFPVVARAAMSRTSPSSPTRRKRSHGSPASPTFFSCTTGRSSGPWTIRWRGSSAIARLCFAARAATHRRRLPYRTFPPESSRLVVTSRPRSR
jgi:hydrogenase maturation protein HypF